MVLTPVNCLVYAMAVCLAGAVLVLAFNRSKRFSGWLNLVFTTVSSVLALYACVLTFLNGPSQPVTLLSLQTLDSSLRLSVDGLACVFIGLISVISFLSALFSIKYMDHYPEYGSASYYAPFQLFVAGMYAIVTVTDIFLFFGLIWQVMTLASFFLIRYEHRNPANVRAAWVYLLMMEIACCLVMAAGWFLSGLAVQGPAAADLSRFDLDRIAYALSQISSAFPPVVVAALVLLFLGFAIKAGLWPFGQIWLPDAHPAAPSPVSALLSGVMIKTGVYGLIRIFLWVLPANPALSHPGLWGAALAIVGAVTLFSGTVQALNQEETKRLLAYHSIGQVGYICLGVGACLLLLPSASTADLAVAGLFGALFHTVNHAFFKSLLFFNAGSIYYATGTQDLNKLGGLMKYMPLTAVTALVASFSIAGVPLFNGFASKWSLYSAAILGGSSAAAVPGHYQWLVIAGFLAVLTSVLTLASFVKFFGVSFLSRVSQTVADKVSLVQKSGKSGLEAGVLMQIPQVTLALFCIFLGLFPGIAFGVFAKALTAGCTGLSSLLALPAAGGTGVLRGLGFHSGAAVFAPLAILAPIVLFFLLGFLVSRIGRAERRKADIWLCGYDTENEQNRYKAHNLYLEVKKYLKWLSPRKKERR